VLPDNVIRDLRVAAGVLSAIDVYDDSVVVACRRMADELNVLADKLEDKQVDDPRTDTGGAALSIR
jgi:hypothetical protein